MSTTGHLTYFIPSSDGTIQSQPTDYDPTYRGPDSHNWTQDVRKVVIEDVRGKEDEYTLDTAGFRFYRRPSQHTRFLDEEEVKAKYYPECMELIKELTGATRVIPYNHRRLPTCPRTQSFHPRYSGRCPRSGTNDNPQIYRPSSFVHVVQTTASCIAQLQDILPSEASALLRNRFQNINLWRPISNPALDCPLVLCDYRSLDLDEDIMEATFISKLRAVPSLYVKYNPNHRWIYKSAMDPEDF